MGKGWKGRFKGDERVEGLRVGRGNENGLREENGNGERKWLG